ncbi:hypothetical protein P4S72_00805 [Vibrio sp. PP-XX7]
MGAAADWRVIPLANQLVMRGSFLVRVSLVHLSFRGSQFMGIKQGQCLSKKSTYQRKVLIKEKRLGPEQNLSQGGRLSHGGKLSHGGNVLQMARHYQTDVRDWIDLSTGVSPFTYSVRNPPESVWNQLPQTQDGLESAARLCYRPC